MAFGANYEEYTRLFHVGSTAVEPGTLNSSSAFLTVLLVIVAFTSLTLTFLSDRKTSNPLVYLSYASVASLSIGAGAIYLSNFVGVYI